MAELIQYAKEKSPGSQGKILLCLIQSFSYSLTQDMYVSDALKGFASWLRDSGAVLPQPQTLLGHPLNMKGTEGRQAVYTRDFAERFKERTGLAVRFWDWGRRRVVSRALKDKPSPPLGERAAVRAEGRSREARAE